MSKKESKADKLGAIFVFLGIIVIYLFFKYWEIALPISIVLVACIIYYYVKKSKREKQKQVQREKELREKQEQRQNRLTDKFGEEIAKLILNKKLKIGMTGEMVIESSGAAAFQKKTEKTNQTTIKLYWGEYKSGKTKKYKKYAVLENDKLTEHGDL